MKTAVLQTRIDKTLKQDADAFFESIGMDTTTAIRIFLKQTLILRKIPFEIVQDNSFYSKGLSYRINRCALNLLFFTNYAILICTNVFWEILTMYAVEQINKALLIHGDSFQKMKEMPDSSVDLILCDPPYNLSEYSTGNMKFDWRVEINNDVATWDLVPFDPAKLADDFKRILKSTGNIFIFTSYNLMGKYHEVFDPIFDTFQFMVWHKTNPVPNIRKSSFLNSCELIVCLWNKGHTWNFTTQNAMHNFIETPICMGKERIKEPKHPTQKPLAVLEHIIKIASNEGDIVFDPFMGVGSTGHAALNLSRKFIGMEIDPAYYHTSVKRLEQFYRSGM